MLLSFNSKYQPGDSLRCYDFEADVFYHDHVEQKEPCVGHLFQIIYSDANRRYQTVAYLGADENVIIKSGQSIFKIKVGELWDLSGEYEIYTDYRWKSVVEIVDIGEQKCVEIQPKNFFHDGILLV